LIGYDAAAVDDNRCTAFVGELIGHGAKESGADDG